MFFMGEANEESNLTIAGFYYICLCRTTGKIEGYAHLFAMQIEAKPGSNSETSSSNTEHQPVLQVSGQGTSFYPAAQLDSVCAFGHVLKMYDLQVLL